MPPCFSRMSSLPFATKKNAKRTRHLLKTCEFLTENNVRWTIDRVYSVFLAGRGAYYRSYEADKNYRRKCPIYPN